MKRKYVRKDIRKYWYYYYEEECVLCSRYHIYKERRYDEKPKEYWDRHKFTQYACDGHF